MTFKSNYIVFSAPSGAGKTTIVNALVKEHQNLAISISATTRERRQNEVDGREYVFLSVDAFKQAIKDGKFLEYEEVHGDYYGTLKMTVDNLIKQGYAILFDIDVNGAKSIKRYHPGAILIFIKPPSEAELIRRLKNRKSETTKSIKQRLKRLKYEYDEAIHFDYIVVNDNLENTIKKIEEIIILC